MLSSIELTTLGMTNTIYSDLVCRAIGGNLSIKGGGNYLLLQLDDGYVTHPVLEWGTHGIPRDLHQLKGFRFFVNCKKHFTGVLI